MKCKNEVQNHIANIQYYADKIKESLEKEEQTIDTYEDIKQAKEIADCINEMCTSILLCVGIADGVSK